jgi:ubiquinone/menaquinone biosynthesis C-methylase UbiE
MSAAISVSTVPHQQSHRCPWWIGWLLASPVRRLMEKPEDLLSPLLTHGNRVLEVGPGMGFFTLPMAERVGAEGRIYCVDVQPQMLTGLERRLRRRHLAERVETRRCTATDLGVSDLNGTIELAVLIHVLHEVADPRRTLHDVAQVLRPNGRLLFIEPNGHVKPSLFQIELELARESGLHPIEHEKLDASRHRQMALLTRSE